MRLYVLVLVALALATAAVLVPPRVASLGGPVITMTVWGQPFEDRLFKDIYARGFVQSHPGVTVDYQRHSDLESKYNAWYAKGYGPEVMRLRITTYHQMVARGMLEPLDAYVNDPKTGLTRAELSAFPPQLLDSLRVYGKLYALPEDTAQYGLYYNRAIFDAYNKAHADDRAEYPNSKWTWEDLRSTARKLTRDAGKGQPRIAGFDVVIWEWPFMQFFIQAGGELWSPDGLTANVNTPAAVEALQFLADLVRDGSWKPYFSTMGGLGPNDLFQNGQVAMYLDGSWMVPAFELNAPNLDFAVAPPPSHTTRRNMGGSVLWGISSHAPQKKTGWEMVRWLVQEPQAVAYWDKLRVAPPAHLGVVNSPLFRFTSGIADPARPGKYLVPPMSESRFADHAAWMVELMTPEPATGVARAYIPAALYQGRLEEEIRNIFREFLQQVVAGQANTDTAHALLERTERNVHSFIDRDRAAKGLPLVDRSRK